VVSLADLKDLEVELDISQADFARLHAKQRGVVNTDAFPDRKYDGFINEISPEANRQKATVQIKVRSRARRIPPAEMNASVAFVSDEKQASAAEGAAKPVVIVPSSAVKDGAVFVLFEGKAVRRTVKAGPARDRESHRSRTQWRRGPDRQSAGRSQGRR
jgi:HlyD family secretion protein